MNAVNVFTVKELVTLYKNDSEAERIELLRFEEVGYEVVVGKGMHKVGNKVIFIMPDYCVSDIPMFQDFIAPNGDPKKSYLGLIEGEPRRIRAKKFNFHIGDGAKIYSNGIILPVSEIEDYLKTTLDKITTGSIDLSNYLTDALGITKYEEPEPKGQPGQTGQARKGGFPSGVYKTDENNINNIWNRIEYPIKLIGTEKVDGSSISIGITDEYPDGFIASRNINKSFTEKMHVGRRKKTIFEKIMFWTKPNLNLYEEVPSTDMFVVQGMPYLEALKEQGAENIIFRGELNGQGAKGSGNKQNPAANKKTNIQFFNVDAFVNGIARKMHNNDFVKLCAMYNFPAVEELIIKEFNSKEEIVKLVEGTFEYIKRSRKSVIEGVVLSTPDNQFSCKYMNNEYDSKK